MHPEFSIENFLTEAENAQIVESVHKLKEHWINRGGYFEYPFFSLGAASYMDAKEDLERYYKWQAKYNPILKEEFSWLYDKIKTYLEKKLGKECEYHSKQALPGFHIFLGDELFEIPIAYRHVDLQYRDLNWEGLEFKPEDCVTFTLYPKLPSKGGGIYVWDQFYQDLIDLDATEREAKLSETKSEYYKFTNGDIVMHSGHRYHQIAAMDEPEESDERISMQGHAILSNNKYYLYW